MAGLHCKLLASTDQLTHYPTAFFIYTRMRNRVYNDSMTSVQISDSVTQCTRNRYRRKMRLASESAEEEETRLSRRSRDRAKRAVQSSQATKNCRGSETAEARDRRKRRLDSESAKEKDTR